MRASMGKWHRIIATLICITCYFSALNPAFSIDKNKAIAEALAKSLESAGISEKSRFYNINVGLNPNDLNTPYESEFEKANKNVSQEVIQHLRSNKGEEFKPAENKTTDKKAVPFRRPEIQDKILAISKKEFFERNSPVQSMPACQEDKTDEVVNDGPQLGLKEAQLMDVLFIRKSDIPLDVDLKLGEDVQINAFDESGKSPANIAIKGANIPCLPFRIRAIGNKVFKDYGKNALRFYGEKKSE